MRIAQVTSLAESVPPLNKNGLEQVVDYLTEELVKMGHEVTLFGTADSKTSANLDAVWPKAVTRDPRLPSLKPETYATWSVAQAFRRHREFDLIHDHTRFTAGYFAGAITTPVVTTMHHPVAFEEGFKSQFPDECQKYLDRIWGAFANVNTVVVSEFQRQKLQNPCTVIHNGLPTERWQFVEKPGEYYAFLGYLTPDKGVAEAIQAILPTGEKLKIAGPILEEDSRAKVYFQSRVQPYLGEQIEYLGPLDHAQKMEFLGGAKGVLMPIQWDEPFGMVAIESMACGTPVIAWNRAAMPEIIEDGKSGYLVKSVEEMTEKIKRIGGLARKDARDRVEKYFSARKMADEYVSLYERILKQ